MRLVTTNKSSFLRPGPIALFSPSLAGGGAEKVLLNLARGLRELGYEVDIVLVKAKGTLLNQLPLGISVIDLKAKRTLASLLPLTRYLKQRRPAGIISFLDHANIIACWARIFARTRVPAIATVHSTWSRMIEEGNYQTWIMAKVAAHAYKKMDKVVAVSDGVAADLVETLKLPKSAVRTIYNPVIFPELWQKAEEPVDHPWFGLAEPPVILGVGRLSREKDFSTLIQAFSRARAVHRCRLIILGEGEERARLEELVKSLNLEGDVSMPGFVDNPYKYMQNSSLFVLSSIREGLPTVLIEALALGLTVISTDCESGPREILENGSLGILTAVGDAPAMSSHILKSLFTCRGHVADNRKTEYGFLEAARNYERLLLGKTVEVQANAARLKAAHEV